jgi:catechol 2,3-dioxygenase-like lactoylglutathione lyase family enzyme
MPRIAGVLETAIYAADLAAATAFYSLVLGQEPMRSSQRMVAFNLGPASVLLIFQKGATEGGWNDSCGTMPGHHGAGAPHFALAIPADDLPARREKLDAIGVPLIGDYVRPNGATSIYFSDPDGAIVELATPGIWANY